MIILSHPTGNTNVRSLLKALYLSNNLVKFFTTISAKQSDLYLSSLSEGLRTTILRRSYDIPSKVIETRPHREWVRLVASRLKLHPLTSHEKGWASVDKIYHDLDRYVSVKLQAYDSVRGVYAYEDGALATFHQAKKAGIKCFYDLPIAYWRLGKRIQQEEAELNPDWRDTMPANRDTDAKLHRKDEEVALSDVIYVASSFSKESLSLAPKSDCQIVVSHYGAPPVTHPRKEFNLDRSKRLNVLFVGSLSQRKGLSYLLGAYGKLRSLIHLTVIGYPVGQCAQRDKALQTCRWIPSLPHHKVLEEMRNHDILIFPSLFEGFGLVILEAMAQGLPVITTSNTGAPDVIQNGREGFIIPIRSVEAIVNSIESLDSDRHLLEQMGILSQQKAMNLSWNSYSRKIVDSILNSLLDRKIAT